MIAALLIAVLLALGAGAGALGLVARRSRQDGAGPAEMPRVWLVRPLAGVDEELEARLVRGPKDGASCETIFTVAEAQDPAWPVAERAAAALRAQGLEASALVCPPRGANPKAGQLAALLELRAPPRFLVSADADVDLGQLSLGPLIRPLITGQAAASWMAPAEGPRARTLGDQVSIALLGRSFHAFPFLAAVDRGTFVGKLYALDLAAVGDAPRRLVDILGEDMALAQRIKELGLRVVLVPGVAPAGILGKSWSDVVARQRRWISVIRGQRPLLLLSYPLFFFPRWTAAPLLLWLLLREPRWAAALALGLALVAALPGRAVPRIHRGPWWALPLAELTMAIAFVQALSSRTVTWRGRRYRVAPGGHLSSAPPAPQRPARGRDPATIETRAARAPDRPR